MSEIELLDRKLDLLFNWPGKPIDLLTLLPSPEDCNRKASFVWGFFGFVGHHCTHGLSLNKNMRKKVATSPINEQVSIKGIKSISRVNNIPTIPAITPAV